jgi:DNA (cytosine-5)-methyltransferase 1|nr:MAG TPA: Cytosine specific methyltransferase [Caudoviricetes sp.]
MITKLNFTDRTIKSYAIRKLTPKECFRLMGVRDNVIAIMQMTVASAKERIKSVLGKCFFKKLFNKIPNKHYVMLISASQQYKQAGNSIVVDVLAHIYESLFYPQPNKRKYKQLSLFTDIGDYLPDMPKNLDDSGKEKIFLTTFSGYDSQLMAADVLKEWHPGFRWTCKGWSDIDKYACQMHNLVFPQFADCALGDITKIDWHKVKRSLEGREVDLFTYSSPCQDISQAGKQMGLQEGSNTRSALLWRVADAVEVLRPKYLLQENVAALVSKKFMPDFQKWLDKLSSLGYVSRWARLNAKNYGVPQNRDRVFCISMRRDVAFDYKFPAPFELKTRLEDVLEEEVADRYFLKDDAVSKFLKANDSDSALFIQFDLPPTHEAAMFLKTWLTLRMNALNGWERELDELKNCIENERDVLNSDFASFSEYHTFPCEGFEELFKENMERKKE